jgi:plasmid stability protein
MASITIRNLEEALEASLRVAATRHGRSMEEEARHILRESLAGQRRNPVNLFEAIHRRMAPSGGGAEPDIVRREKLREPPRFDE